MKNITIVGGGLVGSLAAFYLARRGYNIKVYERRPDLRKTDISAGKSINLVISHRGFTALEKVGLKEEMEKITVPAYGRMTHDTEGNQNFYPYSIHGKAIHSVSRGGLNAALMSKAEEFDNVEFFFDEKCESVDLENATCVFRNYKTGEATTVTSDLVIGADGAFSAVRAEMVKQPRFNYSQEYISAGYKEIHIPAAADGSPQLDLKALHIWPRKEFMLMGLANLDNGFTGTIFGPWEGENSFETVQTEEQVEAYFKKFYPDAIPLIPDYKEQYLNNPASALVIVRCDPWKYKNKVMLVGDAAHAIVPFYGEGMNCGFEDIFVFDNLLDEFGDQDMGNVLDKYSKQRQPNGNAIADLSLRNFIEMRDLVADPNFILRKKIEGKIYKDHPEQWMPLYSQVKFTNIQYADALATAHKQDEIMAEVLAMPDIENKWDDPKIAEFVLNKI
ncbi:MAG: FAD-dependent monooxygenase [Schleiferiaceae bacterium]|jgi:kynurenine 3-monooxygenase|nr:FAD-dependent monooxygenase [Schleiferiaceae bacterium]